MITVIFMTTALLDIEIPRTLAKVPHWDLQRSISLLLKDYTELDMRLLLWYMRVRDLPESRFVNL